jgi:serine/threonine protein kinase/tetratricopeptide (TPR) repeat protein
VLTREFCYKKRKRLAISGLASTRAAVCFSVNVNLPAGTRLGPYEIVAPIGAGGMGEVYRARDPRIGRDVAIKVLPAQFAVDRERLLRFQQEARAAGALNHPNLVSVYDVGEHEAKPYIVEELLEGETLRVRLQGGPLSGRRAIDYGIQIARGMAAAHEKGIIHRDLKPENIFITNDGRVKILDFGLAKLTSTSDDGDTAVLQKTEPGRVMGTAAYMAPEQVRGERVDARSDIFSFGSVLYEMLTGSPAFVGPSRVETMSAILNSDPPDISKTTPALARIVSKCLEKHPQTRFQSASDLAFHLEAISEMSAPSGIAPARVRNSLLGGAVVLLLLAAVVAAYFLTRTRSEHLTKPQPSPARKMLVVLPFENLGRSEDDSFADGISDEIRNRLASIGSFGVIGRSSAMHYKNSKKSAREIGKELGVEYLLEGTVRWQNPPTQTHVRISTELVRAADQTELWSDEFDRDLRDIFNLQSQIAHNVTQQLGVKLLGSAPSIPTNNPAAYEAYLRGLSFANSVFGTPAVGPEAEQADQSLRQAVKLDPNFSLAWAKLAWLDAYRYFNSDRSPERLARAKRDVEQARRISPDDPQTMIAEGYYNYYCRQDYDSALANFDAALRRSPNDTNLLFPIALVHRRQGEFQQSFDDLSRLLIVDPDNESALDIRYELLYASRRYAAARADMEREIALAADPSQLYANQAYNVFADSGDVEAARRELLRAPHGDDPFVIETKVYLSLLQHDCKSALDALSPSYLRGPSAITTNMRLQFAGETQVQCGEKKKSAARLQRALATWDRVLAQTPLAHSYRARCLAYLGRRDDALREMRSWSELTGVDEWARIADKEELAEIYAVCGDGGEAIDTLEQLTHLPTLALSAEELRRHPKWAPLRADPRFAKLLADWKPLYKKKEARDLWSREPVLGPLTSTRRHSNRRLPRISLCPFRGVPTRSQLQRSVRVVTRPDDPSHHRSNPSRR